jgi:hypothetical protein
MPRVSIQTPSPLRFLRFGAFSRNSLKDQQAAAIAVNPLQTPQPIAKTLLQRA